MVIEEGTIIKLEDDFEYLIIEDFGELSEYPGKKYYLAVGLTPDEKIKINDVIYIALEKDGEDYYISKVEEKTEIHDLLNLVDLLKDIIEEHPELEKTIYELLDKYEAKASS